MNKGDNFLSVTVNIMYLENITSTHRAGLVSENAYT